MKFWVVSPNVTNEGGEAAAWKKTILENEAVIMGWGEDHSTGDRFIHEIQVGDIVLIAQGANWQKNLLLAGRVVSPAINEHLPGAPRSAWFRRLEDCLNGDELSSLQLDFHGSAYGEANRIPALYILKPAGNIKDKVIAEHLHLAITRKGKQKQMNQLIDLLRYKKQIILQGPPGTGKTRMAKELAKQLTGSNLDSKGSDTISDNDIVQALKDADSLNIVAGNASYDIVNVDPVKKQVTLRRSSETTGHTSFETIKQFIAGNLWKQPTQGNDDRRAAALARFVAEKKIQPPNDLIDQFKLIQFHPSYSYEDFVRGIVAETKDERIEYRAVNKLFGKIAITAQENWLAYKKPAATVSKEKRAWEYFELFADDTSSEISENGAKALTDKVNLIDVEEDAFRYKGSEGWSTSGNRMPFKDIVQAFLDGNVTRQDLKKNRSVSGLTRQHASYFVRVLNEFQGYLTLKGLTFDQLSDEKPPLLNYVIVIDEINRANLSSVLGELIYALEYRGEKVESMYEVDGSNELVLPPNLYIIGTMNTADRSVGHIDYAIRRRFAFVDVLAADLSSELGDKFAKALYEQVSVLFDNYLSQEFERKDVALGHSYFIDKSEDGGSLPIRLKYEIIPILQEYIRDGVLVDSPELRGAIDNLKSTLP